jgi:hypothetical protein
MNYLRLFFLVAGCGIVLAGAGMLFVDSAPGARLSRSEPGVLPPREEPKVLATGIRDLPPKELPAGYTFYDNVGIENITVMAVIGQSSGTEYLSLDDAMAQKLCTANEIGGVHRLAIHSTAKLPIFAMAGDLLLGGHQDRVLAESLVIAPGENVHVPVFCVEAGRYSPSQRDGARALGGRFYKETSKGQVDLNVKRAVLVSRDQRAVWEQVAKTNDGVGAQAVLGTGTIRNVFDSRAVAERIESGLASVQRLKSVNPVGFAVAFDGQIVAVDFFASAKLCARLADKILRGYIVTGLSGGYGVKGAAARVGGASTMSSRSATTRGQQENLLRYECNDTATGKRVHFCLMAR